MLRVTVLHQNGKVDRVYMISAEEATQRQMLLELGPYGWQQSIEDFRRIMRQIAREDFRRANRSI